MSRNLRTALIFGGFISLIGAAFYPIYFRPLMRLEEYKKEQAINRAGIIQEDVQPPGCSFYPPVCRSSLGEDFIPGLDASEHCVHTV
ncbi:hypothetical protein MJG53_005970 [Ovis ammon polii x Ovis aries]|uniref:Small integral membrane protein 20 n=2 Tax=Ovis TaxID=9935 RepID=A0AAD4UAK2_OVIAM|nr:hypothetical protein MG293_007143 [Ovis ammon polii]KAI4585736.1 hypothetical protein MJG53_005970 [Ovis ammon polii x Ovis aries]